MSLLLSEPSLRRIVSCGTSIPELDYFTITETGINVKYYNGKELMVKSISDKHDIGEVLLKHGVINDYKITSTGLKMYKNIRFNVYASKGSPADQYKPVQFNLSHIVVGAAQALEMAISFEAERIIKLMGNPIREGRAKVIKLFSKLAVSQ